MQIRLTRFAIVDALVAELCLQAARTFLKGLTLLLHFFKKRQTLDIGYHDVLETSEFNVFLTKAMDGSKSAMFILLGYAQ